ncbi:MAG: hypothetical protein QXU97_02460 [Fervidicoccaceae archaeon]
MSIILVARSQGVALEKLAEACEIIEAKGLRCAPYIYALEPPLDKFDFSKARYDPISLLERGRKRIGLRQYPLLLLASSPLAPLDGLACSRELRACACGAELGRKELEEVLEKALRALGVSPQISSIST